MIAPGATHSADTTADVARSDRLDCRPAYNLAEINAPVRASPPRYELHMSAVKTLETEMVGLP